jgi:sugar O-acyltransferase (sialic acid O-acetyltransferase NeuD family)
VLGADDALPSLLSHVPNALVAIGQIESAAPRRRVFEMLRDLGFMMPAIVSSRAHVSRHAHLGGGSVVMHGAIVNASARVGENCIINSQALIEHGATIGDHCHISTGAVVNGCARVGASSFVGSGAVVRQGVVVGEECLIGMQQGVLRDCIAGTRLPGKNAR